MYNEEVKQAFLDSIMDYQTTNNIKSIFSRAESMEKMLGKDLYEFNYSNFVSLFEKNRYVKKSSFHTVKSHIKEYVSFCTRKQLCNSNAITEISRLEFDDISGYYFARSQYFISEDDLFDFIEAGMRFAGADRSMRLEYQAFYGCFWNGLTNDEIYELQFKQFSSDGSSCKIHLSNRDEEISNRFYNICKELNDSTHCIGMDGKSRKYTSSPYLFKSVKSKSDNTKINDDFHSRKNRVWTKSVAECIPLESEYYGKELKPTSISKCGEFYRLHESGEYIDVMYLFGRFDPSKSYSTRYNAALNLYKEYELWLEYRNNIIAE